MIMRFLVLSILFLLHIIIMNKSKNIVKTIVNIILNIKIKYKYLKKIKIIKKYLTQSF